LIEPAQHELISLEKYDLRTIVRDGELRHFLADVEVELNESIRCSRWTV